jgi:hypothetical protein
MLLFFNKCTLSVGHQAVRVWQQSINRSLGDDLCDVVD